MHATATLILKVRSEADFISAETSLRRVSRKMFEIKCLQFEDVSSANIPCAQMAYLSACCTAENASLRLIDEGIHLASGFQLAGCSHGIASIWEADDKLSIEVARKFYKIPFKESQTHGIERTAYALHDAVVATRRSFDYSLA